MMSKKILKPVVVLALGIITLSGIIALREVQAAGGWHVSHHAGKCLPKCTFGSNMYNNKFFFVEGNTVKKYGLDSSANAEETYNLSITPKTALKFTDSCMVYTDGYDIKAMNLTTKAEYNVATTANEAERSPTTFGSKVYYLNTTNKSLEMIDLQNLGAGKQIIRENFDTINFEIDKTLGNKIAWRTYKTYNSEPKLKIFNLSNPTIDTDTNITLHTIWDFENGKILLNETFGGNLELYDVNTLEKKVIANSDVSSVSAAYQGDYIIYTKYENSRYTPYIYRISTDIENPASTFTEKSEPGMLFTDGTSFCKQKHANLQIHKVLAD